MNKEELITYLEGMEAAISTLEEIDVKGVLRIMGEVITVVELDLDVDKGWKPLIDLIGPGTQPSDPWQPLKPKIYEGGICPPTIWPTTERTTGEYERVVDDI